jgi:protein Mpv17
MSGGIVSKIFASKNLFATNLVLSFSLSDLGDWLQQVNENKLGSGKQRGGAWNPRRTLLMSTSFGLTSGFLCHFWYNLLDRTVVGHTLAVVAKKIAYDQLLFSPVCIIACVVVAGVCEGSGSGVIASEVANKGGSIYVAEFIFWPPAQFLNFYFFPTRYRVAFDNLVSLGFDTYTSHVMHRATKKEEMMFEAELPEK